ncbi:MAG TPA: S-methyl-5-thioribose-1-phosphate isomerase [Bacteroidetes bacterium]|nr:S-methyl-5-thioribose-1-phosphate isomerase [Bacteroidota bacterium]
MEYVKSLQWRRTYVELLDQTLLPEKEVYLKIDDAASMAGAIKRLAVRGAPAIGIAAAYGLVLGAKNIPAKNFNTFNRELKKIARQLIATRPTAVNLNWAIQQLLNIANGSKNKSIEQILSALEARAGQIHQEDKILCKKIGNFGANLFNTNNVNLLTHCNAGALATGGQGTALSMIYELSRRGKTVHVFTDETRPLLQGARLTAWELQKAGIPITLICDNMAAVVLQKKKIDAIIVGADRIATNGDTANKIGTFNLALLAKTFNIPFYVAAPYSTFDLTTKSGDLIPIEERNSDEIAQIGNRRFAPEGIDIYNPAFDITPNKLITAFITDRGILKPPFS